MLSIVGWDSVYTQGLEPDYSLGQVAYDQSYVL